MNANEANESMNVLVALLIIVGVPIAIIGIIWEEMARDPADTALYNRARKEASEKADRDSLNRYIFEKSIKDDAKKYGRRW